MPSSNDSARRISRRKFLVGSAAASAGFAVTTASPWAEAFINAGAFWKKKSSSGTTSNGYSIGQSLRFNGTNGYLVRTPGSGNRKTWTFSAWVKRSAVDTRFLPIWGAGDSFSAFDHIGFDGTSGTTSLYYLSWNGSVQTLVYAAGAHRDVASWYHVVLSVDLNQSVASDRVKFFVNGTRTGTQGTPTYPSTSWNTYINTSATNHYLGRSMSTSGTYGYHDGYLAEVTFVDGYAYDATYFGQIDTVTGQWIPKRYSGSFGTNGFYLPFSNASAVNGTGTASGTYPSITGVSGLGADFSGTNNHFTGSGLATTDKVLDSPTNNYCTLNPLSFSTSTTLTTGNLKVSPAAGAYYGHRATMALPTSGKWGFQVTTGTYDGTNTDAMIGIISGEFGTGTFQSDASFANSVFVSLYGSTVSKRLNGSITTPLTGIGNNGGSTQMFEFLCDRSANTVVIKRGGSTIGTVTGVSTEDLFPFFSTCGVTITFDFGQNGYTPSDTSYKSLCTANLPDPAIKKPVQHFTAQTYTGNGGGLSVGTCPIPTTSYSIAKSCRLNGATYLSYSPASSGNSQTFKLGAWIKRAGLASAQTLFYAGEVWGGAGTRYFSAGFNSNDQLVIDDEYYTPGWTTYVFITTNRVFKDVSRWYAIEIVYDLANATQSERVRIYVDGQRETSFASFTVPANTTTQSTWNMSGQLHLIGARKNSNVGGARDNYFSGYISNVYVTDGSNSAVFGEFDANGIWIPKDPGAVTYGTNGGHLDFSDASFATYGLGKDVSGNTKHWTPTGLAASDQMSDTPTNNFATLDLLRLSNATLSNGALVLTRSAAAVNNTHSYSTLSSSGAWGAKITLSISSGGWGGGFGVITSDAAVTAGTGNAYISGAAIWRPDSGDVTADGGTARSGLTTRTTGTFQVVVNPANGKVWFHDGSGWIGGGDPASGTTPTCTLSKTNVPYWFVVTNSNTAGAYTLTLDFGQSGYSPPTGFSALSTSNIPTDTDAFKPDLVWIKSRSGATSSAIFDSVRGAGKYVSSDPVNASSVQTTDANSLLTFNNGGFTLGNASILNTSAATYVAWSWKKGTTPGFDVVTFTAQSSTPYSFTHGLGAAPQFILAHATTTWSTWEVYHHKMNPSGSAHLGRLLLNNTAGYTTTANSWGNTAPTQTTVTMGADWAGSFGMVAYLWTEIAGFSKFGSYTGNGAADGPFVWCGFKPRYVLLKRTDAAGQDWMITDSVRTLHNPHDAWLFPDLSAAEQSGTGAPVDILSNGFKLRTTSAISNASSGTYIFAAFAESPFKYSTAK